MHYRRPLSLLIFIACLATSLWGQSAQSPQAERILNHVRILASEEYGGRSPGTDGSDKAAAYIEKAFRDAGLKPAGSDGFRQPFTMTTSAGLGKDNSVQFNVIVERPGVPMDMIKPTTISWKLGVDYQPYSWSESKTVTGPVVFVGYGISVPDKGYDDYKGINVEGAVVIVLRGLPNWVGKDKAFDQHASLRKKATLARENGAVAICFVNEQGDSSDVLSRFGVDRLGANSGIVAVQVRRTPCARIFPPKEKTLFVAESQINKEKKPVSFALKNTTGSTTAQIEFVESTTTNIIGMVEGTDASLKGQYVVVGAHYDHLGMGDENSLAASRTPEVHHGADDNASGTAGVIELAAKLSAAPPKRSVLFMAFSGEEKGLLGSKHWTQQPTRPLSDVVAMVNMDMIGRLKDAKLNIHGYGTSSAWPALIDSAKQGLGLTISTTADGFGPSDHSSFFAKDIPVLFFFTGLHEDYHRPTDTWDKINADGEAVVLTLVERAVAGIANAEARPDFEKPPSSGMQSSSISLKVTFGIIPDYSDDPNGLKITGVREGTPAMKAGLMADDVITQLGPTQIKNIYDLMSALGGFKPRDTAEAKVLRKGKLVTLSVTFVGK